MNTTLAEPKTETSAVSTNQAERELVDRLTRGRVQIEAELAKVIVGQKGVIEEILIALFSADGNCPPAIA